jgi:hypothetical protein
MRGTGILKQQPIKGEKERERIRERNGISKSGAYQEGKNESKNQDQKSFQLFVSLVHEIKGKLHGKAPGRDSPLQITLEKEKKKMADAG